MDVIYTDFAKAFDCVPHKRLLKKMEDVGVTGNVLPWMRSFLSNRSQCVRVDNDLSSSKLVKSGLPQGSVLGPILFIIFINHRPDMVQNLCQLWADVAKVYHSVDLRDEERNKSGERSGSCFQYWKVQLPSYRHL